MWLDKMTPQSWARSRNQTPDLSDLDRVQAFCGLVQDQDARPVQDRLGDPQPLAKSLGEPSDGSVAGILQAATPLGFLHRLPHPRGADPAQARAVTEVLVHPQLRIERRSLREIAQATLGRHRVSDQVYPSDLDLAVARGQVAAEDAQAGRFARPVGAEQPKHFATVQGQADAGQSQCPAESAGQIGHAHQGFHDDGTIPGPHGLAKRWQANLRTWRKRDGQSNARLSRGAIRSYSGCPRCASGDDPGRDWLLRGL